MSANAHSKPVRACVVCSNAKERAEWAKVLCLANGFFPAGSYREARLAAELIPGELAELAVIELQCLSQAGLNCARTIGAASPRLKLVLVLAPPCDTPQWFSAAVTAGAVGLLEKPLSSSERLQALHSVVEYGLFVSARLLGRLPNWCCAALRSLAGPPLFSPRQSRS